MADKRLTLEQTLRKIGWDLGDYQVARFYKIPEEFKTTPCDFMGHTSGGRCIMIEAKEIDSPSLKIHGSPGLASHQWLALTEASKCNALALICWARGDLVATIDIDQAVAYRGSRKSIPWDLIPPPYIHALHGDPFRIVEPFLQRPPPCPS